MSIVFMMSFNTGKFQASMSYRKFLISRKINTKENRKYLICFQDSISMLQNTREIVLVSSIRTSIESVLRFICISF